MTSKNAKLVRRDFLLSISAMASAPALLKEHGVGSSTGFRTPLFDVALIGSKECLWSYRITPSGKEHRVGPPVFNVDNQPRVASLASVKAGREPRRLPNGSTEYSYVGTFSSFPDLSLTVLFQASEENPILRFNYILRSARRHALTKPFGRDELQYLKISFQDMPEVKEVRLSNFLELVHAYTMEEVRLAPRDFEAQTSSMGPLIVASNGQSSMLVAYEHGSQVPDAFLNFQLRPDRIAALEAVKGNYLSGQILDDAHNYQTVWFETGGINGDEERLASAFRSFVLRHMTQNLATRKPLIYYNTWNAQERSKWFYGKTYGYPINRARVLKDIDIARQMGIDVYVIDSGWFDTTGDWNVNLKRFPDGLRSVKRRLDRYGMKLGLWFGPRDAGAASKVLEGYRDCIATIHGKEITLPGWWEPGSVDYSMCLVSRYMEAFGKRLVQLSKEVGVTYFKWDGVSTSGCDAPGHWHGSARQTPEERAASYGFQIVQVITRLADQVAAACPDAIVDIDTTETDRFMGLGFLAAGRFFTINNGPYYHDYDIPINTQHHYSNVFAFPGPARTWICRTPLPHDKWIPSILCLTHYFADDPFSSQQLNMASLILGQNGIWGDLPRVSDAGIRYISETLGRYKQVWNDVAAADPIFVGQVSGSPEIHEKIHPRTGRGAVVIFAMESGEYAYTTTRAASSKYWASEGVSVRFDRKGRAKLKLKLQAPAAALAFFGVE